MKNSLIRKMFIILVVTVFAVSSGVFGIVYALSYRSMMEDIRQRADGVSGYILSRLSAEDIIAMGDGGEAGETARMKISGTLDSLKAVGNIKHLYIVRVCASEGVLLTSMSVMGGDKRPHMPSGALEEDLRRSLAEGVQVAGRRIYHTEYGSVFTIFWPVMVSGDEIIGAVGMEFDVAGTYNAFREMALYGLTLSGAMLIAFAVTAYLSMSISTEPIYKKLAYMDILTGYQNRTAFENRLYECEEMIRQQPANANAVTIAVFDVNNLKVVNDAFGHKMGDTYLRNTADILFAHVKAAAGRFYRIGGDEFAAVFTDFDTQDVRALLEGIRAEKKMALRYQPFSCASGAAMFRSDTDKSMRDVFIRADEAMYEDKRRIKNLSQAL